MYIVCNYKTRALYADLKKTTKSFLLWVLHHTAVSCHIEPLTFGDYSSRLTPEGGWWEMGLLSIVTWNIGEKIQIAE